MAQMQDISIIFISIILEAFPFIMLGVVISAIIQEFVPDNFLQKIIPKNPILGSIVGVIMGFFIPACDCAVIPIARRLIKKGIPLNVGITFMLASPIINPVVILATVYSFGLKIPSMILYRTLAGMLIAIVIGIILSMITKNDEVFNNTKEDDECNCGHEHHKHDSDKDIKLSKRIMNIVYHAKEEFFDISKYLIIGALLASIAQIYIPREIIVGLSSNNALETIILMIFAFVVSLCSTADSFVAKTFINQVTNNSILAFLLLGPMIDIKNTIILFKNYNKKFVIKLLLLIFILVFAVSLFIKF